MKRTILLILCTFITLSAFSQGRFDFFKRKKKQNQEIVVHDTVYVYLISYDTYDTASVGVEEFDEIPMPYDTLPTDDKFKQIVLFDNNTWAYYNIAKPILPDELDYDHWETDQVHTYRDIQINDLPDEVDLPLIDSLHAFCIPAEGELTSGYKMRRGRPHRGVDIDIAYGDPIRAAFDGEVRTALPTRLTGGYGNVLVVRHANGLETYYGHLAQYIVQSGDLVKAGEVIGYGGSTGRSTGPHLHFEVRYMGQSFDPERIFDFQNGTLRSKIFTLKKSYLNSLPTPSKTKTTPQRVVHIVKQGDNLSTIAKRYGTTVDRICKLNKIKRTSILSLGKKLIIR